MSPTSPTREAVTVIDGREVEISWRRSRSRALVWYASAFAVVLLYIAFGRGQFQLVHRALMSAMALCLGYFAAVQLANVTRLSVRDGALWVEHGPLPWRSRIVMPLDHISRLRFDAHAARLEIRTHDGQDIALLDDLRPDRVRELESRIASTLAITTLAIKEPT